MAEMGILVKTEVLSRICPHDEAFKQYPHRRRICSLCQTSFYKIALQSNSPEKAFRFLSSAHESLSKKESEALQKVIIDQKDAVWAYRLAEFSSVIDVDIAELEKIVIESKNLDYLVSFAAYAEKCNFKKLEKIILDSGDAKAVSSLIEVVSIKDLARCDLQRAEKIILKAKDPDLSYAFAVNVKKSNVKAHGKIVLKSPSDELIFRFARFVKGADVRLFQKRILKSKDLDVVYDFYKYVKGVEKKSLEKKLEGVYEF